MINKYTFTTYHISLGLAFLACTFVTHYCSSCSPETTLIVFDLNDVIVKPDIHAMLSALYHAQNKRHILTHLIPTSMYLARTLWHTESSFEDVIHTCKKHNHVIADLLRTLSTCQKPISGTIEIIKSLHTQGYELAIASNIGSETIHVLQEKYPHIFKYFSSVVTCDTINNSEQFIKKPDTKFFELFQKKYNPHKKRIIFIDDKRINVQAAQNSGMHALVFKNSKTLRKQLQQLTQSQSL
jgi:HAD superfamily hydrolase (TIGR01509 family)